MAKPQSLARSLSQLVAITDQVYNPQIRPIALALWKKHLQPDNPQWQYLTAKSFSIDDDRGAAHIMALIDERLPGKGLVGYFASTNSTVGASVIEQAAAWLRDTHGLHDIYGPINGTLPNDYRINLEDNYKFPGEPVNPSWYLEAFERAGFRIFNQYVSGVARHYQMLMRLRRLTTRKPAPGYEHLRVRPFETGETAAAARDFEIYHELRNAIFPFQSVYCPAISLAERRYNASGKFDPEYSYFLVDGEREIGFVMAYAYQGQLILKTLGLLPEYRGKSLSELLLIPIHEKAARAGLRSVVYGMIRVGNNAFRMMPPGVAIFRHYVTMHRRVD
jgi:hypothetical protein